MHNKTIENDARFKIETDLICPKCETLTKMFSQNNKVATGEIFVKPNEQTVQVYIRIDTIRTKREHIIVNDAEQAGQSRSIIKKRKEITQHIEAKSFLCNEYQHERDD